MRLAVYEWKKLLAFPALWAFLGLSLTFDLFLIAAQPAGLRAFFNETSAVTAVLGQRVDERFLEGLAAMPATEERDMLLASAAGMEDIFETYDAGVLADFYADVMEGSPLAARWMTWKYELLAERVERLAETDAAMDLYAGPATRSSHQFLFDTLFRSVLCEGLIAAMLATLYLLGYEETRRTEGLVCSARTGRRLRRIKVLAAAAASMALYALLALCALVPYFLLYDYGGIWSANVSSQFNYLSDMLFRRPFLTWGDLTVAQYLTAALALGAALTAVFSLMAAVFAALAPDSYLAALALGVMSVGGVGLASILGTVGWWTAFALACFHPAMVWLYCGAWFTELGLDAVLPWQETVAVGLGLLAWGGGTVLALRRLDRKDVL